MISLNINVKSNFSVIILPKHPQLVPILSSASGRITTRKINRSADIPNAVIFIKSTIDISIPRASSTMEMIDAATGVKIYGRMLKHLIVSRKDVNSNNFEAPDIIKIIPRTILIKKIISGEDNPYL